MRKVNFIATVEYIIMDLSFFFLFLFFSLISNFISMALLFFIIEITVVTFQFDRLQLLVVVSYFLSKYGKICADDITRLYHNDLRSNNKNEKVVELDEKRITKYYVDLDRFDRNFSYRTELFFFLLSRVLNKLTIKTKTCNYVSSQKLLLMQHKTSERKKKNNHNNTAQMMSATIVLMTIPSSIFLFFFSFHPSFCRDLRIKSIVISHLKSNDTSTVSMSTSQFV